MRNFKIVSLIIVGLIITTVGIRAGSISKYVNSTNAESDQYKPTISLSDLSTGWLKRSITKLEAMPGLNNDIGSIQVEADPVAVKHPIFPPYSGGNEISGVTIINGKNIARISNGTEIKWTAYGINRRTKVDGWELNSQTSLLPNEAGVVVSLTVLNTSKATNSLTLEFLLSGRAMNTGGEGYAWSVPSIPTDVFSFKINDGLNQEVLSNTNEGNCLIQNENANAYTSVSFNKVPTKWTNSRRPMWNAKIEGQKSFTINILFTYGIKRSAVENLDAKWKTRMGEVAELTKRRWELLWQSAFSPNNNYFSGFLPIVKTGNVKLDRLYYNGVLTLLTCRRIYPSSKIKTAYLTLWPRRGEGSIYLAWDLPYTSGILSRLDPKSLIEMLKVTMSQPMLDFQVVNLFTYEHTGAPCCAHPMAIYNSTFNLLKNYKDKSWLDSLIIRKPSLTIDSERALQVQNEISTQEKSYKMTTREAIKEVVFIHRKKHLPNMYLVDYGNRTAYLECITTYAHGTAGLTAQQIGAMKQYDQLFGGDTSEEQQKLLDAIKTLYRNGDGYFNCLYPNGKKIPAANLYDLGLVLTGAGESLSSDQIKEIVSFVRNELITPTWARSLASTDLDVLSGIRCDHQWAGSFPAWIPQFVLGIKKSGRFEENRAWILKWLEGVSQTTYQGPFAQAYWAEDVYPKELGAAAKCYDELVQGNHWVCSGGTHFADMILECYQ
jgi:hypothetical protein